MTSSAFVRTIDVNDLLPLLDDRSEMGLVDVRESDEFASWHIPGAVNIPLGQLADRLSDVPRTPRLVTICALGSRATEGAAVLAAHGVHAQVLEGGMSAWGHVYEAVDATIEGALVTQIRRRGKGCLSYVIGAGTRAIVLDPSTEIDQYMAIAQQRGMTIAYVIDTHLHADHLSGARSLARASGAQLLLNPADPFAFDFTPIEDNLRLALSDDLHLTVSAVSAPGHTEGSTVYRLGDFALFTGDTLFLESVGRPDLADQAEAYAHALYRSLHTIVLPLSDDLYVFPAHFGDAVTVRQGELVTKRLGDLRRLLPALAYDEPTFVAWAVARVTNRPPNYQEIVRYNSGHSDLGLLELEQMELGPNRCAIAS